VLSFTYTRFAESRLILSSKEEHRVKVYVAIVPALLISLISACRAPAPVCPPDSVTYVTDSSSLSAPSSLEDFEKSTNPLLVEINGKEMLFDEVIHGALCGGDWRGTIYVACDLQIATWEEEPTFLKNCNLNIEPGTVIYVAAHNNDPYYQGCSCHTGEIVNE
jgi:hypothetical protein